MSCASIVFMGHRHISVVTTSDLQFPGPSGYAAPLRDANPRQRVKETWTFYLFRPVGLWLGGVACSQQKFLQPFVARMRTAAVITIRRQPI